MPEPEFVKTSDSRPLLLEELSDDELKTIIYIERHLYEGQQSALEKQKQSKTSPVKAKPYLAQVQVRHPRVLLLDGGRGTGKTSMLLTLAHRWNRDGLPGFPRHDDDAEAYRKVIDRLREDKTFNEGAHDDRIPEYVSVVGRILDFDPLPPQMPLIAGIIQAWQPLAENFDDISGRDIDCDDEDAAAPTLMDLWHQLFRVAAVGHSPVPQHRGLIEQVLDRQEQVKDWQRLEELWQEFVDKVIERGKCLPQPERFKSEPIFVIMIDDCDLQVARIRELLPALRLLYHPNVFFIVAADQHHMTGMLSLSFYGQQNEVAHHQNAIKDHAIELVKTDRWAGELAESSVNKVFPLKNRWKLRRLALHELLNFPKNRPIKLKDILDEWPQDPKAEREWGRLGKYLLRMALSAPDADTVEVPMTELAPVLDPVELPPILSYRTAHQIVERASAQQEPKKRALEAIRHLLGRGDSDDLVRISKRRKQETEKGEPDPMIEYLATGNLTALFHEGFREHTGEDSGIVLSARPDFAYSTHSNRIRLSTAGSARREDEITAAVIAASLRDDGYGVIATSLTWDIRLALAWTEERVFEDKLSLALAFQWPVHVHPSPLQLLMWSKDWRDFIHDLQENPDLRRERIAYAWIYYQLKWLRRDLNSNLPLGFEDILDPFDEHFNDQSSWQRLLEQVPEVGSEQKYWTRRMQRLAIPELGIPIKVQEYLLAKLDPENTEDVDWLWEQRRRSITDAIVAAADQANVSTEGAENEERVSRVADAFEKRHRSRSLNKSPSPWWERVEKPQADRRSTTPQTE